MRSIGLFAAAAVLAITAPATAAAPKPHAPHAEARQILPVTLVPAKYDLHLAPDAEHLSFKGTVAVTGNAPKAGRTIVLNAKGLTIDDARLDDGQRATVTLDDKLARATLTFPKAYAPGQHTLTLAYHGPITTGTLGLFAMDYDTA
jgi:aminopeptidase N